MPVYKTSNSGLLTRREYTSFLAGNSQFIPSYALAAYDSIALTIGMTLGANDTIVVAGQDANNIAFTIFGTEITEP